MKLNVNIKSHVSQFWPAGDKKSHETAGAHNKGSLCTAGTIQPGCWVSAMDYYGAMPAITPHWGHAQQVRLLI